MSKRNTKNPEALSWGEMATMAAWWILVIGIWIGSSAPQTRVSEILSQAKTPTLNILTPEQARDKALAEAASGNPADYEEQKREIQDAYTAQEIQILVKEMLREDQRKRKSDAPPSTPHNQEQQKVSTEPKSTGHTGGDPASVAYKRYQAHQ